MNKNKHITDNNIFQELGGIQEAPSIDVFIISGQSNSSGYLSDATTLEHEFEGYDQPYTECFHWYNTQQNNGDVETSEESFLPLKSRSNNLCGPELSLGRMLGKNNLPVALIQVARFGGENGMSSLTNDLSATENTWNPNRTEEFYDVLTGEVDTALTKLREIGYIPKVRSLFWVHGETDSSDETWANEYEDNLNLLISSLRERYGSGMKAVINRCRLIRPTSITTGPHSVVREAQENVGKLPNNAVTSVDDFRLDGTLNTGSHYGPMEYCVLGQRLYEAYSSLVSRQFPVRTQYYHATVGNSLLQDRFPTANDWRMSHNLTGDLLTLKDYQATGIIGGVSRISTARNGFDKYTAGVIYAYQVENNTLSTTANAFRVTNGLMSRFFLTPTTKIGQMDSVEVCMGGWEDSPRTPMSVRVMLLASGYGWMIQKKSYTNKRVNPNVAASHETQATKLNIPITFNQDDWEMTEHIIGVSFPVNPTGGHAPTFLNNETVITSFGFHISSSFGSIVRFGSVCFNGRHAIPQSLNSSYGDINTNSVILTSENGTKYKVQIDNDGNLTTTGL